MKPYLYLFLLCFTCASAAQLYKVVDENGRVTYTDKPQPGAEQVDLGKVNSVVMPAIAATGTKQTNTNPQRPDKLYKLTINSPKSGTTIRDNLGRFTVSATLEPQAAGVFQLLINDVMVMTQSTPVFEVENVNRGEHHIKVQFLNSAGRVLASSPKSVIYLHQASQLINPN